MIRIAIIDDAVEIGTQLETILIEITTNQAFVPNDLVNAYRSEMDRIFGQNSCYIMTIRPFGGIEIK